MMKLLLMAVLFFTAPVHSHVIPSKNVVQISRVQAASTLKVAVKSGKINCVVCSTIVQGIDQLLSEEEPEEKINEFLKKACITLDLEVPYVCDAMVDTFMNELYFVAERVVFTPDEICGLFVDDCGTPVNPAKVLWNLTIPGGKPAVKPWPIVNSPKKTQRVLHLSDIHIDRDYAEGSEADCEDENKFIGLCCRNYPSILAKTSQEDSIKVPAGKWGSIYNCDLPYRTFESAMRHISQTHKDIDYIILTGDKEAHDMWDYTKEKTQANIANISQVLNNNFPNTPIYESVGNHEGVPCDAMAPHNMDEYDTRGPSWLYNILADTWSRWISSESVNGVQYRASYVEYPSPGLKLISINSIYCSKFNFYIYINQTDPDGTLTWLISELLDSEKKFENTIAAQFYGHTHNDHFQVYYEDSNPSGRPTHFNFITPSITTNSFNNPAYRIYTIDGGYEGATYTVLDTETYTTDLDEANSKDQEPRWFFEYSARDTYNLPDLSPSSWSSLIDRLAIDDELFEKFHRLVQIFACNSPMICSFYFRSSHEENCVNDLSCRQRYICHLRAAKSFEEDHFCAGASAL